VGRALAEHTIKRAVEHLELLVTTDHRRVQVPGVSGRVLQHRIERGGGYRLGLALEVERLDGRDLDGILHEPVRALAQQDLAWSRGLLEASGDVHRVAGHQALAARRIAGDDLARVHTDPRREPDAVVAFEVVVQRLERLPHVVRCPNGSQRIVFVELRDPEHRHHGVADELLDRTAVPFDHGRHLIEVSAHDTAERFGIEAFAEGRRAGDIGEHDRHDLADLRGAFGLGQGRGAVLAESSSVRVLLAARWADAHGRILGRRGSVDPHLVRAHRCGLALQVEVAERFGGHLAPNGVERRLTDQDPAGGSGGLQPSRDVRGVADRGEAPVRCGAHVGRAPPALELMPIRNLGQSGWSSEVSLTARCIPVAARTARSA
jgi:hypothetical protein